MTTLYYFPGVCGRSLVLRLLLVVGPCTPFLTLLSASNHGNPRRTQLRGPWGLFTRCDLPNLPPSLFHHTLRTHQDSGEAFEEVLGGDPIPDPTCIFKPAIKLPNGVFLSQTCACLEGLAEAYGYEAPADKALKAYQAQLNLYDIFDQAVGKRIKKEVATTEQAAAFCEGRVRQFFAAAAAGFELYPGGALFTGDDAKPTAPDFQLLATVLQLGEFVGTANVDAVLGAFPALGAAVAAMKARPRIKAWLEGGMGGLDLMPPFLRASELKTAE